MEYTMELDDLKLAWQTLDRRLQQQNALGFELLKSHRLDAMRRGLRPLAWGQAIQILIGALGALGFAPFWIAHRHEPALLVAGLVMHAYCIGLIVVGALMLARIAYIDYTAPVLVIQRQLLTLRRIYLIGGLAIGLPWWFLTAPLLVVLTHGVILDVAPVAIWSQLAVGAIGLAATWLFVRWANSPQRAAFGKRLEDSSAGGSLRRAQSALDELARFGQDD